MRLNPVKKKIVYHYSKFAPYNKILTIKLDNGVKFKFRARTADRTVIKEAWARKIYTKHNFEIKENDTVFDLGGHIGAFTVLAGKKVKNGKVYAFEPIKENFEMLKINLDLNELNNIYTENIAIANKEGTRTFNLSSFHTKSSVGYDTGGHSLYPSKDRDQQIQVKTSTLEAIMQKYEVDHIDYLKLDTEGAEFEILCDTPKNILKKIRKIVMELHPFGENTKEKMINFLEDCGYENNIETYGKGSMYMVYSKRID